MSSQNEISLNERNPRFLILICTIILQSTESRANTNFPGVDFLFEGMKIGIGD